MPLRSLILSLLVISLAAAPGVTLDGAILGDQGELFVPVTGTYDTLFPEGGHGVRPATAVLAIDITQADGITTRDLVPGSETDEVDGVPSLVFEDSSRTLFVVWESKRNPTSSRLLIAARGPGGWPQPVEISGDVAPLKDEPRVAVARDRFLVRNAVGELIVRHRTVIHVAWWEESPEGGRVYYTPVILAAGFYAGWNPVVALDTVSPAAPEAVAAAVSPQLARALVLAPGRDLGSVVIGFVDPTTSRLSSIEARVLPGEIGFLADGFRSQIIDIGARNRDRIVSLADTFRSQIIDIGVRFNGGILSYFADRAAATLVEMYDAAPNRPLTALADEFRSQIIDIGVDLLGGPGNVAAAPAMVVEVAPVHPDLPAGVAPTLITPHLVQLQLVASRPAPSVPGPGDARPAQIFISEDGEEALVGWPEEGAVAYVENLSGATETWSETKRLVLGESLDEAAAEEILRSRVQRRR